MYYSTITNKELQYFHNRPVHNFTVKLSQILTSPIFKVEEIITDSIYKIYPLFYTGTITSSNSNDKILENKVIICQKTENETFLTFISDENSEIVDYSEYGTYYEIGDQLTESQFNAYISLLRQNVRHTGSFRISQGELTGSYGTYEFEISNATIIDNGIVITDETIASQPKVKLTDNVFRWSSYILKLDIIHYTGVNILDDTTSDFKVVETIEIELTPNVWVDIPVETLETDYIISLDATVEIRHDRPEIHLISGVDITEITPNPIQIGQNTDIYAQLLDTDGQSYDLTDGTGQTVYFYEVLNPILYNLIAEPSIIQTSETTDITVQMKDSDGSKIGAGETVYFYAVEGVEPVPPTPTPVPTNLTLTSDKDILSYSDSESCVLSALVKDQDGVVMEGQSVVFKQGSTVLDTVTTDSNGEAKYVYASQGVGDVTLTVECMNLQETYELEDLYDYDLTTYNSLATSPLKLPNGNFELTYKSILKTNTAHNTNLNIYGVLNDDTTQVISVIGITKRTDKNGFHTSFVVNGVWEEYWHSSPVTVNSEYLVKYIYNNGQHSLYVDGDLLITTSKIMKNMHDIAVGPNQNEWIKDLKVKPL